MSLGEKIQILRKQKGLSQEQLAEKITISRQAISRWELNESKPDLDIIVQLSKIFDVSTDYLLTGNNNDLDIDAESAESFVDAEAFSGAIPIKVPAKRTLNINFLAKLSLFCTIISPGIYLILGFIFGLWHPGWIVFVIPPLIFGATQAISDF